MSGWIAIAASVAVAALIMAPERAMASERNTVGVSDAALTEVGAKRRVKRGKVRLIVQPAYRYRGGRIVTPLFHQFDLYAYRRPYFVPGPPPGVVGIRRDGMGTAAYGFGVN